MIMKLPVYFRQSWQIMLKDRQYSLIYVVGVALSMAFVMAFLMFMLMSVSGIYPEKHRSRMLVLSNVILKRFAQSDRARRQCSQCSGDVCGRRFLGRVPV